MNEDFRLSKVEILIQQKKFTEAEKILRDLLSTDVNNPYLLSLLAEVYFQTDRLDDAIVLIDNAIGLSPDTADLFYIKARIVIHKGDLKEAESLIHHCIQLDPYEASFFALLALVKLERKQFEEALEIANRSLEIDAENLLAINTRSTALYKLDRKEESFETIEGALREDPNNAYTHANYGWGLLEKGQHKKGLEHFQEALKNDPTSSYAQAGILEAMKATNPIYRLYLKYAFWMGNLTSKNQWAVIIGVYFGFRGLNTLADNNEVLRPYLNPLIFLLALIAFSTWIIAPIGNLFLRFNKYGQLLLSEKQKMSSNFVALSLGVFLLACLTYFVLSDDRFLVVAAFGFSMMLPCSVMFSKTKYNNILLVYTVGLALVGILAISLMFLRDEGLNMLSNVYIIGFIAFQWLANFLIIGKEN
jgi:tetratricopeptide (TPR) repeat protein